MSPMGYPYSDLDWMVSGGGVLLLRTNFKSCIVVNELESVVSL